MTSYGTVALFLFFGLVFAMNMTSGAFPEYDESGKVTELYKGNLTNTTGKATYEDVIGEWLSPELLATGASLFAIGLGAVVTGNIAIVIAAGAVAFLANYMMLPMTLINSMGFPEPIRWFIFGFMNLLLLVAMFSFIRGKDW